MKRLAAFLVKTRDFSTFAPCVQTFGDNACHPSLREGSGSADAEILPLRYAQGCGSCAQDDKHYLQMSSSVCRRLQFHGVSGQSPTATQTEHLARALPAASPPLRAD